jgi:hypothetical protein
VTDDPRRYARPTGDLRDGASCIPTSFIASSVASISCLRRIGCIPSLGIFDSIHQRWLSIKAVFDWTFNIKCVLIVADLVLIVTKTVDTG